MCIRDRADALAIKVNIDQLNLDHVADLQNVGNLVHALVAYLADVDQTVNARQNADKCTELEMCIRDRQMGACHV